LHFLYALSRKGDHERMEEMIDEISPSNEFIKNTAKSISFYASEDYQKSFEFCPEIENIWKIGGSNAQRSVFDLTIVDIFHKNGKFNETKSIIQSKLSPMKENFSFTLRQTEYENALGLGQDIQNSIFFNEQLNKYQN
jgi:hypothetical protein